MKYLLLVCAETQCSAEPARWEEGEPGAAAQRHGILVTGSPRQPAMEATLQFRGGSVLITDGPYACTQGQIRGFDIVDGEQLEEVIELASGGPAIPEEPGVPGGPEASGHVAS